ncbi:hypothetical protein B834_367 [Enterococcus mundtii 1A]|nr:hypothetical protein [Enterococcus mundtii 1A]
MKNIRKKNEVTWTVFFVSEIFISQFSMVFNWRKGRDGFSLRNNFHFCYF